jgi:hypothetical protein
MGPRGSYRVHRSPQVIPILSQMNPIQNVSPYFSKIHSDTKVYPKVSGLVAWRENCK